MANPTPKTAAKDAGAKKAKRIPEADYSDVVTDNHLDRIKSIVPEDEYKGAKVVAGPAW